MLHREDMISTTRKLNALQCIPAVMVDKSIMERSKKSFSYFMYNT